ncbi:MAG: hypothetical protein HZA88_07250 [Verrucomicrobia bacterium]|nr:hypothetical protein [Verrucomicrobiota bacterium]
MTRFRNHLFYFFAVLLHALLLLVFGDCVVSERTLDVITQFIAPEQKVALELPPPRPPERTKTLIRTPETQCVAPRPGTIPIPLPRASMTVLAPVVPDKNLAQLARQITVNSLYQSRLSRQARIAAINRYGGGGSTNYGGGGSITADQIEDAVCRALNWLQKKQNEDGSWGDGYKTAMTGLALLTLLAHGDTQACPQYGQTVQRGVQWLMDVGLKNGNFFPGQHPEYQHAIATYALAEDYALTQNSDLLPVLEGAVARIVTSQAPTGAWEYDYDSLVPSERRKTKTTSWPYWPYRRPLGGDLSISGWNIQALKAAKNAGTHVKGLDEAMRKALFFCRAVYDDKTHRFGYAKKGGGSDGMLAVGILSMMFLGAGDSEEVRSALRHGSNRFLCNWSMADERDSYLWYYVTQAMFQAGGSYWVSWNRDFRDTILENQMPDGHWPVPGSKDDVPVRPLNIPDKRWTCAVGNPKDSPVYHTTMLCMTLEVYYRLLPTFR